MGAMVSETDLVGLYRGGSLVIGGGRLAAHERTARFSADIATAPKIISDAQGKAAPWASVPQTGTLAALDEILIKP